MRFRLDAEFGTRDFGDRFHRAETRNSVWRPSRMQVVAPGETVALAAMPPFTAISLESGLGGNEYPPTLALTIDLRVLPSGCRTGPGEGHLLIHEGSCKTFL